MFIFEEIASLDINNDNSTRNLNRVLGNIVNIIVSFDMGWSKRGNKRSYDSLNGYSAIIGFLTGKILNYRTRNRKCNICDLGHPKNDHNCRKNFQAVQKQWRQTLEQSL